MMKQQQEVCDFLTTILDIKCSVMNHWPTLNVPMRDASLREKCMKGQITCLFGLDFRNALGDQYGRMKGKPKQNIEKTSENGRGIIYWKQYVLTSRPHVLPSPPHQPRMHHPAKSLVRQ